MKLVLVHGRAQEGKDPVILKKLWVDTLKIGLDKSDLRLPIQDEDIIFPFYGDKLDELVKQVNQPIDGVIKRGDGVSDKGPVFFKGFLEEIAKNSKISDKEIQSNLPTIVIERGAENWEWVQAILRSIDRYTGWGEFAIKKYTYDVFLYFTIQVIKDSINNIVLKSIPNEPCVVVGHSMGTIITYNLLRDSSDLNIVKYITLGSPLGLNSIKKYLKTPLLMPPCVKPEWFNAYDESDVIALTRLDKDHFDINPAIINKNDVDNQTDSRHGIEGYLNDKVVARQIYDALLGKT